MTTIHRVFRLLFHLAIYAVVGLVLIPIMLAGGAVLYVYEWLAEEWYETKQGD